MESQLPLEESDRLRALQEERSRLNKLLTDSGFIEYLEILEAQIQSRKNAVILNPLKGMDQVLEQEYKKGEIASLMLAKELTGIRLGEVNEEISDIEEKLNGSGS